MTVVQVQKPNLTDDEIHYAIKKLGREPNEVEWAMLEAQWSEHCSYKSSKPLLKLLPSKGRRVLVGPGFDAGAIDLGNGWVATLHIESHNHPSAIDPYGGAATGVGGVVRDILSMGTRPIALLDPLRFGSLESSHSRWLFDRVVRGIGDYGNCIGVPTVGGEVEFDPSFERNCLVDVVCLGLGRKNKLVLAEARHPGDQVYIIGGSTGRDGIRGAGFASKTLTEKSDSERSAVQVPDPFMKKLIIEAVLEAVEAGLVRGMKDLGGGGLTCGLSEIASKGGTGMEINLDNLRTRESDMESSEIMISESQERMILIVQPSDEQKLKEILDKWDLGYSRIGQVTRDGLLVIKRGQRLVARTPAKFVAEAPLAPRSSRKPSYIDELEKAPTPHAPEDFNETLLSLLASPNICSREWIYKQYDFEVGLKTIVKPGGGDSAILRLPNGKTLAISADGNSKLVYLNPYWGTINILSESLSNLVAAGAEPVAVVDHLQYGDPGNPEVYWTFKEAIRAIRDYLKAVRVPCVGGKVSFYNEDSETRTAIKPSPVIAALGLRDSKTPKIGAALKNEGDDLLIVGTTFPELGGSEYYETIQGVVGGPVPTVNLRTERTTMRGVAAAIKSGFVEAAHDISRGGLAVAIAEMAILGKRGCSIELSAIPKKTGRLDQLLFSESRPRFILESKPKYTSRIIARLKTARIKASKIGQVQNDRILVTRDSEPMISVPLQVATDSWSETLRKSMEVTL
ncbi:MAG TPA: phosphoribosylformylglycinamidine synthase subunit PurL [Candidatus Dormibacteraeota bacterium]|nr:phosphoribosylformylglycinamidine synthase subunit PurL [Candidatus Dormibacteraeota bacterium]